MSKWAAVIGKPIDHSLSPVLHTKAYELAGLDWEYRKYEVDAQELPAFLHEVGTDCAGLSVTMPAKAAAVQQADVVDGLAKMVGAANTLVPAAGLWGAFNTDVQGITETVLQAAGDALETFAAGNRLSRKKAVLLGTGATASSALAAATTLGYSRVAVIGRTFQGPGNITLAARNLGVVFTPVRWDRTDLIEDWLAQADLVISTVPAHVSEAISGAFPDSTQQYFLDVTYGRGDALRERLAAAGATVLDPLAMLTHQGLAQVKLMSGREVQFAPVYESVLAAAR